MTPLLEKVVNRPMMRMRIFWLACLLCRKISFRSLRLGEACDHDRVVEIPQTDSLAFVPSYHSSPSGDRTSCLIFLQLLERRL